MIFIFDGIEVRRPKSHFTCPVKSVAIFAHNEDIDIKTNEVVKMFENCKTIE